MATTSNTYTGNGSNKLFSITFPYLDTSDIDVYLNGTLQTIITQYTFANATTVEFVAAPANGAVILLDRSTDDSALQATFFPGSSIKASDLNDDFDQVLYIAQETSNEATTATTTAATATTTANTALSQSAAAVSTANTASSNASAAVSTANTASTNASNAVTTANTASSNATTAVNTANAATSTANTASSNASAAVSTANTASSNASAAVSTANTASSNASAAVSTANAANSTANTASGNASTAVTTANNAVTTANTANSNSNTAVTTANAAAAAVANAVLYTTVANVAAIPGSPANNAAVEVTNSTGIESFTPLSGLPAGFIGSSGLSVRIIYQTSGATWTWIQYFPNDPETRYLKLAGGTLTGTLAHPLGAAATPSITFTGDPNTGIYSPGADQLAVATNGVQRINIEADGDINIDGGGVFYDATNNRLAIGTTSPGDANANADDLVIKATGQGAGITIFSDTNEFGNIYFGDDSSTPHRGRLRYDHSTDSLQFSTAATERLRITSAGLVGVGTSVPSNTLHVVGTGRFINGSNPLIIATDGGDPYIYTESAAGLKLGTNSAARLTIDSSGRVGIGTSTVSTILNIRSNSSDDGILLEKNDGTGVARLFFDGTSSDARLDMFSGGAAKIQLKANGDSHFSGGRVGIGTTTPGATLDVAGSNGRLYLRDGSTNTAKIVALNAAGTGAASLIFETYNAETARIDSSGRLLIGTSSSSADATLVLMKHSGDANGPGILHLSNPNSAPGSGAGLGLIRFSNSTQNTFASIEAYADATSGSNDYPGRLVFSCTADGASSPTERMKIDNLGYIFSVPTYNNSSAYASNMGVLSNGIFYRSTSSIKYKTEVEDIDYAYSNALLKCRPVWYRSTCKADPAKHGYWGFIAEEVAKIDPRLVHWKTVEITYDDKGATVETPLETPEPEGVQYDRFVPHLLNLIKRQGEAITDLQAEVAALKAK
jgi:hypothetical protein